MTPYACRARLCSGAPASKSYRSKAQWSQTHRSGFSLVGSKRSPAAAIAAKQCQLPRAWTQKLFATARDRFGNNAYTVSWPSPPTTPAMAYVVMAYEVPKPLVEIPRSTKRPESSRSAASSCGDRRGHTRHPLPPATPPRATAGLVSCSGEPGARIAVGRIPSHEAKPFCRAIVGPGPASNPLRRPAQ